MKQNYLFLIIISSYIIYSLFYQTNLEMLKGGGKMQKIGNGCCKYKNSKNKKKDYGSQSLDKCLDLCSKNPACWAIDSTHDNKCSIYIGDDEIKNIELNSKCKKTECWKKTWAAGPQIDSDREVCPFSVPKEEASRGILVQDEIIEDINKDERSVLEKIKQNLKEIIKVESAPTQCDEDEYSCRPGSLTSSELTNWLKAEQEIGQETCDEPDANEKCTINFSKNNPLESSPLTNHIARKLESQISEMYPKLSKERIKRKVQEMLPTKNKLNEFNHIHKQTINHNHATLKEKSKLPLCRQPEVKKDNILSSKNDLSQNIWRGLPKHAHKPLDGKNMYNEITTPAFSNVKQNIVQNIPKYSSLFGSI